MCLCGARTTSPHMSTTATRHICLSWYWHAHTLCLPQTPTTPIYPHLPQARRYESELASLRGELASMAPKEEAPSRSTLQRLASELKVKDERLKQLRAAIKALEGKLASLLKEKTDL